MIGESTVTAVTHTYDSSVIGWYPPTRNVAQVYSDGGKRELQQLRSTFLDIKAKLGEMEQVNVTEL